ncbi:hypothetical protein GCM10010211_66230 [Streptomyces albospinus]|uniref:Uncharacterized protein n=1 Tax=Streptomyces albospinus TaxID=285515 RepID=A0ABQ2VM67_9ACTN|nr:hypothetical protein GCM10010211_66230 [Streptomyces albospinus]
MFGRPQEARRNSPTTGPKGSGSVPPGVVADEGQRAHPGVGEGGGDEFAGAHRGHRIAVTASRSPVAGHRQDRAGRLPQPGIQEAAKWRELPNRLG